MLPAVTSSTLLIIKDQPSVADLSGGEDLTPYNPNFFWISIVQKGFRLYLMAYLVDAEAISRATSVFLP